MSKWKNSFPQLKYAAPDQTNCTTELNGVGRSEGSQLVCTLCSCMCSRRTVSSDAEEMCISSFRGTANSGNSNSHRWQRSMGERSKSLAEVSQLTLFSACCCFPGNLVSGISKFCQCSNNKECPKNMARNAVRCRF